MRMLNRLLSIDFWFRVAAVAGLLGFACVISGVLANIRWLATIGFWEWGNGVNS